MPKPTVIQISDSNKEPIIINTNHTNPILDYLRKLNIAILFSLIMFTIAPYYSDYVNRDHTANNGDIEWPTFSIYIDAFIKFLKSTNWPFVFSICLFLISPHYSHYVNKDKNARVIKELDEHIIKELDAVVNELREITDIQKKLTTDKEISSENSHHK